ncbi:MAG: hypothetical protein IJQ34_04555 [Kiritimatiellae bacterium]|nr:hypothetical protein [Kiritimatiellia bacterium]
MKRIVIIFLSLVCFVSEARAEALRGVVTFACEEFLVVAPERKPHYRGTLVKLVMENGERAFGPSHFESGEKVRIQGEWVDKTIAQRTFQAALVEKAGRIDELPEPITPKLSDYRKGWRSLTRLRLEGVVKTFVSEGEGENTRTHIVLKSEGQRLAVCVWDKVDGEMFAPGSRVSAVGVSRTVLDDKGEAIANELQVESAADLELLAEKPVYFTTPLLVCLAAIFGVVALCLLIAYIRSRAQRSRLEAVALDRQRIAGELHDTLEQYFAGAKLLMTGAMKIDGVPERALLMMRQSADMMASAKRETREAVMNLRSDTAVNGNLKEAVRALAAATNEKKLLRVKTNVSCLPEKMDIKAANDILLIIREAMTNAVKHGKAKNILIVADSVVRDEGSGRRDENRLSGNGFVLRILNDGSPFDPSTSLGPEAGHFGLAGMRERAERNGFKLSFGTERKWTGVKMICDLAGEQ